MPSALTYPGVYVEEIPSGVRTITGVATSIAAFVGRARRGPVDEPVFLTNYGDYERTFGGLWGDSTMSYAVRDFFRNGGAQAIVVRVHNGATAAVLAVDANLELTAADLGAWGNDLRARVDHDVKPGDASLFNLTLALVRHDGTGAVQEVLESEVFRNVSLLDAHARRVDKVLLAESRLARGRILNGPHTTATTRPAAHAAPTSAVPLWGEAPPVAPATTPTPNATNAGLRPASAGPPAVASGAGSNGDAITEAQVLADGLEATRRGMYALDNADLFNLLCIPPYTRDGALSPTDVATASAWCLRKRAIFLVDPPASWNSVANAFTNRSDAGAAQRNAAVFFPRLSMPDPLQENQLNDFAPCGAVAGVIARTDAERGVWKAPAGLAAGLVGVPALSLRLTEGDIGRLNPVGINCLRAMPDAGRVIWGSRTRDGADSLASEWKYLPVRRLTLFIEESLYRGTQWVVFEPNDEPLWSMIRLNVGAFMHSLFRQGAFQGATPREAYEVKCDRETTTQNDVDRGVVNIVVRFAPLKPAEFVVIKIQQIAGQVQV